MAASERALEIVKDLEERRHGEAGAKRQWDKLVSAYAKAAGGRVSFDSTGDNLKALIDQLALFLDKREENRGCPDDKPCAEMVTTRLGMSGWPSRKLEDTVNQTIAIDLEVLADKIMQRLMFEMRIERERTGWAG